jgi:hypothetical protein
MTEPTHPDPAWKRIVDDVDTIRNPRDRDVASDAITDAYSLGVARGVERATAPAAGVVNATERPEDTVRRYAGELHRLAEGLAAAGIPLRDGPLDGAEVDTALAAIARLTGERDALRGPGVRGTPEIPWLRGRAAQAFDGGVDGG